MTGHQATGGYPQPADAPDDAPAQVWHNRSDGLPVSEVFGPVWQGEGPHAGRRCAFVRLGHCNLSCSWCVDPDTPVLMADWTEKAIRDVKPGDLVASFRNRRFEITRVEATMLRWADERVTVRFGDREVIATPDHVFATPHQVDGRLRSKAGDLEGRHVRATRTKGWLPDEAVRTDDWWTGWLQGVVLGDGHVGQSEVAPTPKVWLRVCDKQLADAFSAEVNRRGAKTTVREQKRLTQAGRLVYSVAFNLSRVPEVVGLPNEPDEIAGFLAGFFDAEGSVGRSQISVSQKDDKTLDRVAKMCRHLGIPVTVKHCAPTRPVGTVTINGLENVDRFMRLTRPVLDRKRTGHRRPDRMLQAVAVEAVKEANPGPVVNLTTASGFFFANGALVEQCDTPFTWDSSRYDLVFEDLSGRAVIDRLPDVDMVVLSGGEPMMHQHRPAMAEMLADDAYEWHIETNGTIAPNRTMLDGIDYFTVSPKIITDDPASKRLKGRPLAVFADLARDGLAVFKFVADTPAAVDEAARIAEAYDVPAAMVWIMPEGVTAEAVLNNARRVADATAAAGFNLTLRQQVLMYGQERAR